MTSGGGSSGGGEAEERRGGGFLETGSVDHLESQVVEPRIVHAPVGKRSFESDKLRENAKALLDALLRAKPASAKGTYLRSITLSSTMGPGIKIDPATVEA